MTTPTLKTKRPMRTPRFHRPRNQGDITQINIRILTSTHEEVVREAHADRRSLSGQIDVLLCEALAARKQQRGESE